MSDPADAAPEDTYFAHLIVYSKLIRGNSSRNPIRSGAEALITAKTDGAPRELLDMCHPSAFFANSPGIIEIDPRLRPGCGVFLYRPVLLNRRHYSLFLRMESRSENGADRPGRQYPHCAMIAVADKWEPALIPFAATLLFEKGPDGLCLGNPPFEAMENRLNLPPIRFRRSDLPEIIHHPKFLKDPLPGVITLPDGARYVDLAQDLACHFGELHYFSGRWLPFAMGLARKTKSLGVPFYMTLDDGDAPPDPASPLEFSDDAPPLVHADRRASEHRVQDLPWHRFRQISQSQKMPPGVDFEVRDCDVWADQVEMSGIQQAARLSEETRSLRARPAYDAPQRHPRGPYDQIQPRDTMTDLGHQVTQPDPEFEFHDRPANSQTYMGASLSEPELTPRQSPPLAATDRLLHEIKESLNEFSIQDPRVEHVLMSMEYQSARYCIDRLNRKLALIDDHFPSYLSSNDDGHIVLVLSDLLRWIAIHSLFRSPKTLQPLLNAVLYSPALPELGIDAGPRGSMAGVIMEQLVQSAHDIAESGKMETASIPQRIGQLARAERNMFKDAARPVSQQPQKTARGFEAPFSELIMHYSHRRDGNGFDPDRHQQHREILENFSRHIRAYAYQLALPGGLFFEQTPQSS